MIETRRLKNVIFVQTILSFVLSRKIISDLVLKEIHGMLETKNLAKEQINKYKMTEIEIYKKFGSLSEDELNTKSNKNVYVRNDVMKNIIKCCRG